MKRYSLPLTLLALISTITACHKVKPVAAAPPVVTPERPVVVAETKPAPPAPKPTAVTVAKPPAPVNTPPAKMTQAERDSLESHLARLEDALFDYDKATIRADATTALRNDVDVIRGILANYPSQKLTIQGHADERGSAEYNLGLGDRRATAAKEFLATMGVPNQQLGVASFGKERPICTDSTENCWQRNRRVHIVAEP